LSRPAPGAFEFLAAPLLARRGPFARAAAALALRTPAPLRLGVQPILPTMDAMAAYCGGY
jgi:hypothetical protein